MGAIDFVKFAAALGATESTDNPHAWGDEGLAVGRWQMHPAFVDDYYPDDVIEVHDSWNTFFRKVLLQFVTRREAAGSDVMRAAMEFHLGVEAVRIGQWDAQYADRFSRAWAALTAAEVKP